MKIINAYIVYDLDNLPIETVFKLKTACLVRLM